LAIGHGRRWHQAGITSLPKHLLPVQAPTKYELAINRKTAKSLGLDVSASLLARSDDVIESIYRNAVIDGREVSLRVMNRRADYWLP
jgi:hypothetical protein